MKKIVSAIIAAALVFAMPICAIAAEKPDEWSGVIELEQTNATH